MHKREVLNGLRFVARKGSGLNGYCIYTDPLGNVVYLRNVTKARLEVCRACATPQEEVVADDDGFCKPCKALYAQCEGCDDLGRINELCTTLNGLLMCSDCLDADWTWCESCDGYRADEDWENHQHGEGRDACGCESPAQKFQIRNDGEPPLSNDTRATASLPAGVISDEGITAIRCYLLMQGQYALADALEDLDPRWQTRQGNYTKRLSRLAYKSLGIKLPPAIVSQVGCLARDHSTAVDFEIEITRDLNLSAYDFGHEESCFWTTYYESRCILKSNGGFGLRTFLKGTSTSSGDYVTGRAWVLPLKLVGDNHPTLFPPPPTLGTNEFAYKLTPTFETLRPDAFVVFNGYGDLEGYAPARLLSHMAGMTYRKVELAVSGLYVNNESGYLVAPEEIAEPYTDGCVNLSVSTHSTLFHDEANESIINAQKKVLVHA